MRWVQGRKQPPLVVDKGVEIAWVGEVRRTNPCLGIHISANPFLVEPCLLEEMALQKSVLNPRQGMVRYSQPVSGPRGQPPTSQQANRLRRLTRLRG